jgi:hypothetical protein
MIKDANNPFKWRHFKPEIILRNTRDFLLNENRRTRAAKRFFRKMLGRSHVSQPRVINVDKNRAYIGAFIAPCLFANCQNYLQHNPNFR